MLTHYESLVYNAELDTFRALGEPIVHRHEGANRQSAYERCEQLEWRLQESLAGMWEYIHHAAGSGVRYGEPWVPKFLKNTDEIEETLRAISALVTELATTK